MRFPEEFLVIRDKMDILDVEMRYLYYDFVSKES